MKFLLLFTSVVNAGLLLAQPPDTASASYKTGYYIGSWLPFLLMGLIFLLMYLFFRKRAKRD